VPRIIQDGSESPTETLRDRRRNFSIVSLQAGVVSQVSLVWVGKDCTVASEQILYQQPSQVVQPA